MKHKIALLLFALFLAVGFSWAQDGTTYYVNGSYTGGGNDGTSAKPYQKINHALTVANALGDNAGYITINIAAGTYKEDLTITRGKITLVGVGPTTVIGGDSYSTGTHYVVDIRNSHITLSNLKVISHAFSGTGTRTWPAIWIHESSDNVDPIIIEQVTIDQQANSQNTGSAIYINAGNSGATIRKVTINGHENGINVNASTTITDVTLDGKGLAASTYGIKVEHPAAVTMSGVSVTGYNTAAIYYNSRATSSLTGSTLKESQNGVRIDAAGTLNISNTSIYGEDNYSPIYVGNNNATVTLDNQTKLYKSFANLTTLNGFFPFDASRAVTDNGASYFYGTNYASSRVVKVSNAEGLRNAYPVEMLSLVFGSNNGHNTRINSGDIVLLPAGDPISTATLNIYEAITLDGNNTTLKASDSQANMLLNIQNAHATGTTINNLTITGSAGSGIYTNQAITLSNVTLTKNQRAMWIDGSVANVAVTAAKLTTSDNREGGVMLTNGSSSKASLSLNDEHIGDKVAVYMRAASVISPNTPSLKNNVVTTANVQWTEILNTADKAGYGLIGETSYYVSNFWLRTPAIVANEGPTATTLTVDEQLWNSILTGGTVVYDGKAVQGEFQWKSPRTRVTASGNYDYVFIPANQQLFALTSGNATVNPLVYYKVTTDVSDRGKIIIKNASPDNYYTNGQQLELIYVPYDGYKVSTKSEVKTIRTVSTNEELNLYTFGMSNPIFVAIDNTDKTLVTYTKPDGAASMSVFSNGLPVSTNTYVERGSVLNVVVTPATVSGTTYSLKSITYQYGTPVLNGLITVGREPIIIQATMEVSQPNTYLVTLTQADGKGIVMFYDESGNIYMPGMAVPAGTKLTPVVTPAFGYKLKSLAVANGSIYSENVNGATKYTIDRDVTFAPVYEAVSYPVTASMDNTAAGSVSLYNVNTPLTGLQLNGTAVTARISINSGYRLIAVIANGKELRVNELNRATTEVFGETVFRVVTRKLEDLTIDQTQQVYTNYNTNYGTNAMYYPFIPKAVPAGLESERLGSFQVSYRKHGSTEGFVAGIRISGTYPGGPSTGVGTYDVKIERAADEYYNDLSVVVESGLKILDNYLPLRNSTYTKKDPAKPTFTEKATYDGSVYGDLAVHPLTSNNWVVSYRQNNQPIQYPVNAGVYDIIGFRAADTLYNAQTNVKLGTFTINKAAANASVTYATDILQGQSLAVSRLSGNANIDGMFSWAAPETKMTTAGVITTQKAVFTPYSSNYTTDTNLATSLNVLAMAAGSLRTVTVNVTNADKGTYTLTREAIEIAAGTTITAGEKIRVSFETTDPAYTAVVKINGTQYPNGAFYIVPATGDMVIDINFMPISQAPAIIVVSGISLSSLEKMATMGDVFTLTPSITPSNASDQRIFWSSSDQSIATVDSDGKVTVLRAGTCAITATTAYGHSVSCELTAHTTANDGVIAGVNVYSLDKQYICIEAASPVKVRISDALGRIVYNGNVSQRELVRLSAGIYFVVVTDQTSKATVKVVL